MAKALSLDLRRRVIPRPFSVFKRRPKLYASDRVREGRFSDLSLKVRFIPGRGLYVWRNQRWGRLLRMKIERKELIMIKTMLSTVGIASFCAFSQASAQAESLMDCNELTLRSTLAAVEVMPPGSKKTELMNHLDLAKEMMSKNDLVACKTHLNEAVARNLGKRP